MAALLALVQIQAAYLYGERGTLGVHPRSESTLRLDVHPQRP